jgi:hypothetical protein
MGNYPFANCIGTLEARDHHVLLSSLSREILIDVWRERHVPRVIILDPRLGTLVDQSYLT